MTVHIPDTTSPVTMGILRPYRSETGPQKGGPTTNPYCPGKNQQELPKILKTEAATYHQEQGGAQNIQLCADAELLLFLLGAGVVDRAVDRDNHGDEREDESNVQLELSRPVVRVVWIVRPAPVEDFGLLRHILFPSTMRTSFYVYVVIVHY